MRVVKANTDRWQRSWTVQIRDTNWQYTVLHFVGCLGLPRTRIVLHKRFNVQIARESTRQNMRYRSFGASVNKFLSVIRSRLYSAEDRVVRLVAPPLPVSAEELVASPVFSLVVPSACLPFLVAGAGLLAPIAPTMIMIEVTRRATRPPATSGTVLTAWTGSSLARPTK